MKHFQLLPREAQDVIRLEVFIEEGRSDLIVGLFLQYKGKLMDIVLDRERAKELYVSMKFMNKHGLADRFAYELGLERSVVKAFDEEYERRFAECSVKIPSVRRLIELIDLYK